MNFVSWYDALRFANWLHNGQGTGSTEDGAYTIIVETYPGGPLITRKPGATWVIPSEDEWYKAAYYSGAGGYYDYPTSTNSVPSNDLVELTDPGNNATFRTVSSDWTIGSPYYRTEVGDHENSDSPYGTFDQGGNLWELNEAIINGSFRGVRGGSFYAFDVDVLAVSYLSPSDGSRFTGFRVSEVPEPATMAILMLGGLAVLFGNKKSLKYFFVYFQGIS